MRGEYAKVCTSGFGKVDRNYSSDYDTSFVSLNLFQAYSQIKSDAPIYLLQNIHVTVFEVADHWHGSLAHFIPRKWFNDLMPDFQGPNY